jgi:integrase
VTGSHRHQQGYIFRKGQGWYLRYYDAEVTSSGETIRKAKCKKLVDYGGQFRSKSSVKSLAAEFLLPLNDGTHTPTSIMTLRAFVAGNYLPYVKEHKRPSTYDGYRKMWKHYLESRTEIPLRDFGTFECEKLLCEIAKKYSISTTTLKHVKNLLSGIFRYAIRTGSIRNANPVRDSSVPKGKASKETYAYSLPEIRMMLTVLLGQERTVVAVAAFTGLRRGELRGLRLSDYDGEFLTVRQSIWRSHVGAPKGKRGSGSVPVIPFLKLIIDEHIATYPLKEYIFENQHEGVLDLDALSAKVIRPALLAAGVPWHGWHACRRGIATNLHRLGIPDITIAAILRHCNVSVTRSSYIKSDGVDPESIAAMRALETSLCNHNATTDSEAGDGVIVQ